MGQQRILHLVGSLGFGGIQSFLMNIYKEINKKEIQFDFIINHKEGDNYIEQVKSLGGKVFYIPSFNGKNLFKIRKDWDSFFRNHPEYSVFHCHVRSYVSLIIPIAKKYGLKVIVHSHSTSNGCGVLSFIKRIIQLPLRFQGDYLFACSEMAGKWLFGKKCIKRKNFYIVRNSIDLTRFRYDPMTRYKYRNLFLLNDEATYMHIGRFHPSKNHHFIIKLFSHIHEANDNSVLFLIGDGPLKKDIEEEIKKYHLERYVFMLGNREDSAELLQAADCFLFPSIWEGLGIAAVEAQASGLKCLCNSNLSNEIKITNEFEFIDLRNECKWFDSALNLSYVRKDTSDLLRDAGYDIRESSKRLELFYKGLL